MKLVIVESPYAGDTEKHTAYARAALADCLARGEAPFASHLLYTQPGVLDDSKPAEREQGIDAGLAWGRVAAASVFYTDLGWSDGMRWASWAQSFATARSSTAPCRTGRPSSGRREECQVD